MRDAQKQLLFNGGRTFCFASFSPLWEIQYFLVAPACCLLCCLLALFVQDALCTLRSQANFSSLQILPFCLWKLCFPSYLKDMKRHVGFRFQWILFPFQSLLGKQYSSYCFLLCLIKIHLICFLDFFFFLGGGVFHMAAVGKRLYIRQDGSKSGYVHWNHTLHQELALVEKEVKDKHCQRHNRPKALNTLTYSTPLQH